MFNYKDSTGTNFLENQGALDEYRAILESQYLNSARVPNSAFTLLLKRLNSISLVAIKRQDCIHSKVLQFYLQMITSFPIASF